MKILHISHSDLIGGAARAAYRLHMAQLDLGIDSQMLVRNKLSDHWSISGPSTRFEKSCNLFRSPIGHYINKLQRSHNVNFHSGDWLPSRWAKKINSSNIDIVHLHWVAGETMSIEDIGRIKKPIVWTLHDMWPFCGTEHVTNYDENARWKIGYSSSNRNNLDKGLDLDKLVWLRKKKAWKKQYMHIVAPSNWMAECAKNSILFKDYPIIIIPNALDTDIYKPLDKFFCRNLLNLPLNKTIILFGAMGGGKDPNKGFDLLIASLNYLSQTIDNKKIMCLIFGQSKPQEFTNLPFETRWLGHVHDDTTLCSIYNAADIMIVPSRTENLPQAATEAHSCGTPVVAFNTTGLKDIIEHLKTGYLANAFDSRDLASGIKFILNEENIQFSLNARTRATTFYSQRIVANQYLALYQLCQDDFYQRKGSYEFK
ncbi:MULTISPECIES: glycosyltransferase family 4 protein [Providencia]|uniref:Glycosyl transferase family protein n=2 Tax=Providencia TaxID=586 RepID=A0A140NKD0_PROSM|nr:MULTISPECIES: glycosyltransferase family 4 protein [Providencia]AFH93120.1 glycosyl transferase family protein [Providencia stuartii MRSN 2154]